MTEVTEKQIESWKKQHGEVYELNIPLENDKVTCYLRKPDRKTIAYALSVRDTNPLKAKEIVLENCFLAGDERIKTDDELFLSACTVLDEMIVVRVAELKKK